MKKKNLFCLILTVILSAAFVLHVGSHASAVSDTCEGVPTIITSTQAASVVQGSAITLTGITTVPSTSYGVTVTSSTLDMSATNASPAAYSEADTSTTPSPTTGAKNYTAYYPNWTLTATGSVGSQIVVQLVSDTAVVSGIGPVDCPLKATLATITITSSTTAPITSTGGSSPTTSVSSAPSTPTTGAAVTSPSTSTTTKQSSTAASSTTPSAATPSTTSASASGQNMTIVVKDSQGKPISGASASLGSSPPVYTNSDGEATFTNVSSGSYQLSVAYQGKKVIRTVKINAQNTSDIIPIQINPITHKTIYIEYSLSALGLLAVLAAVVIIKRRKSEGETPLFISSEASNRMPEMIVEHPIIAPGTVIQPLSQTIPDTTPTTPLIPVEPVIPIQPVQTEPVVQPAPTVQPAQPVIPAPLPVSISPTPVASGPPALAAFPKGTPPENVPISQLIPPHPQITK